LLVVTCLLVGFYVGQVLSHHGGAHQSTTYYITVDIYYSAGTTTRPVTGACPDGSTISGTEVIQMYDRYTEWYLVTVYYSGHTTITYTGMTYAGQVGYGTGQYTWSDSCPTSSGSDDN
jgi:hypothetical protein